MGEWREIFLNEIITLEYGVGLPQENRKYGDYPVYGSNGIVDFHIDFLVKGPGIIVGRKGSIGEVCWSESNFWPIDTTYYVQPKNDVDLKWLYYKLKNLGLQKLNSASGTPGLNRNDAYKIKISMPETILEQSKIAEILTTIDDAIEKTERIIAKYRHIKQGLLQDLLTKGIDENGNIRSEATHKFKDSPLGRIPVEWDIVPINSIGKIITGNTPSTKDLGNFGGNYLFVTPSDISGKEICKTERTLTDKGMKFTRIVPKNSICVVCIGSTIGKIGIIKHECATNQQINTIICSENVDYNYIYYACLAYLKRQLDIEVGLQAVPIVNKNTFSTLLIPLMGKPEQVRISHILNKIDYSIKDEQKYYNKLKAIKQGLMQDLLSGKVRVTHLLDKGGKSDECHP